MSNPFEHSQAGERWVARFTRADGSTAEWRIVIVELEGERCVAVEHDAYSTVEDFPYKSELWRRASFERVD